MTFTQESLRSLIKDLLLRVPQIEPFMFVVKMTVLPKELFVKQYGAMATACCTRNEFIFCDEFIGSLPVPKQRGLILHEIFHGALGHLTDPYRDNTITNESFRKLANLAQDYVNENFVREVGKADDPRSPENERAIQCNYEINETLNKYAGWSWRNVYDDLRANAQVQQNQGGTGDGEGLDDHQFGEGEPSDGESANQERIWKAAREESEKIRDTLAAGNTAGAGDIAIKPDIHTVPWQQTLSHLMTSVPDQSRKSWSRVKRRPFALRKEYVPVHAGTVQALNRVYMLVDTSGSMHYVLDRCAADIMQLMHELEVQHLELVYYDVGIQERISIEQQDMREYRITHMKGGGGTCVRLAMEELVKDPEFEEGVFVVLTDGYDDYRIGDLPIQNLIWLSYEHPVVSDVGTCVMIDK